MDKLQPMTCDYCGCKTEKPYTGYLTLSTHDGEGWEQMFFVYWRTERAGMLLDAANLKWDGDQE